MPTHSKNNNSLTRPGGSQAGSTPTPKALAYLQPLLPPMWERYFVSRIAGRYFGLLIECPRCHTSAPKSLKYSSRKWRWLSVHLASCKARKG